MAKGLGNIGGMEEDVVRGRILDLQMFRRFIGYASPQKMWVYLAIFSMMISVGCELALGIYAKMTLDGPIGNEQPEELPKFLAILTGLLVLGTISKLMYALFTNIAGQNMILDMRMRVFSHLQKMSLSFFNRNPVGRLMTRVTSDIENLNELFTSGLIQSIQDIALLFGITFILFWVNPVITGWILMTLPLLALAMWYFRSRVRPLFRSVRAKLATINSFLQEQINGMSTIQIFNRQETNNRKFRELNDDYLGSMIAVVRYFSFFFPTMRLIVVLSWALLLWKGGLSILEGSLTFGGFFLFWYFAQKFFEPIRNLSEKYNILQNAMSSGERIFQLLDEEVDIPNPETPKSLGDVKGRVEFDNVQFRYLEDTPVLKGVSFTVEPGETVAIVGITGAGKTTIISLLTRLYDIQEGAIRVDGIDIRELDKHELRQRIGVVLQDVFLFSGSIADNIRLGEDHISRERVEEAARHVNADRFIEKLPGTFDSEVMERGATFSTGEKQLLSFARALAFDPAILILDEATSSVDSETEALIQDALDKLTKDRTSIIIAHRLSTIRNADKIVVLHKGTVREVGPHDELMAAEGLYFRLYQLQHQEEEASAVERPVS